MLPTSNTHRRLSIAKEMYLSGVNHSRKNFISDFIHAILNYDFCVEMIVKTILQDSNVSIYHGGGTRRRPKNFHELTTGLISTFSALKNVSDISDLHDLRNSVQHRGLVPSGHSVQRFTTIVRMFFDEICTVCYSNNINFDEISLAIFIPSVVEKLILEKLEGALREGSYDDALSYAKEGISYHKLLLRENMGVPYRFRTATFLRSDMFRELTDVVREMDETLNWLVDRVILEEYYNDVKEVFGDMRRLRGKYIRETTTKDRGENSRTILYNFILGTQRYIQNDDISRPYIFDICIKEKTNDSCTIKIGYACRDNIINAKVEIRYPYPNVLQQINLPLENGLHEVTINNLETGIQYYAIVNIRTSNVENSDQITFNIS